MVIKKDGKTAKQQPMVVQDRKNVIGAGSGSQVVFFSNVSREEENKMELLTIAGNFGTVEKHLFLSHEAFVQLGSPEDAEMLVKYYTLNPLTIKGHPIRLNICTKYKTLNTDKKVIDNRGRKDTFTSPGNRRSNSPGNRSSSRSSKSSSKRQEPRRREETKSSVERNARRREESKSSVERDVKKREETKSSVKSSAEKEEKKKEETKSGDEEVSGVMEGEEEQDDATTPVHTKPAPASLPLDPYDENNPVGLEFVKMGYYCRLCFLFYSNEETAKKIHCSSQTHYDKLKKHLEKNKKGKKME